MSSDPAPHLARARVRAAVDRLYQADAQRWEVACQRVVRFLEGIIESMEFADRSRVVVDGYRVKEPMRTLEKVLKKSEGGALPGEPGEVVGLISDLAGVKVLCKSSRDLEAFVEVLEAELARTTRFEVVEPVKNYHLDPKPSGYRAFHAVLGSADPKAEHPIRVEIQVRTRLQDAWGELTHDDLYKPGGPLAPSDFHTQVAASMANLLSEVDRLADLLAQDIEQTSRGDGFDAGAETQAEDLLRVTVTRTGPGYAIAEDELGRRGLIRARDVRSLAEVTGDAETAGEGRKSIKVSDLVGVGDVLPAAEVEYKGNRYFAPVEFAERR
ncbi:GTP pyrophosphokinase [Brevibacterium ihuae]|uniref:GTP pyrophosphokinase n=1 Tax=Brevibacterium ihuae TaxID=1631743 RepID=UPI000C761C5C|nr:RelA/SpoT domain-containing protein [Brevibacterium ihuae]